MSVRNRREVLPRDQREERLTEYVEALLDGAYYVAYYRSGKAQVMLNEEATAAFTRLQALISLEREGD